MSSCHHTYEPSAHPFFRTQIRKHLKVHTLQYKNRTRASCLSAAWVPRGFPGHVTVSPTPPQKPSPFKIMPLKDRIGSFSVADLYHNMIHCD